MKIKNVSCTQFAGVRDKNIAFDDGVNVVFGKNESGKTTLVNLIYNTLFKSSKIDGRSDKDFVKAYFPSKVKNKNLDLSFADGKITIEAQDGTYTLTKEWCNDNRVMLSTPDGVIRDEKAINDIMSEILVYGKGVYDDMLLTTQYNADETLKTLLNSSEKTDAKQEIVDTVSKAFLQGDGVSMDAIEDAIVKKIEAIEGKHWDYDRQMPVRRNPRYSNGLGEILEAYYAIEDAKNVVEQINTLQAVADNTSNAYNTKSIQIKELEKSVNDFSGFASQLSLKKERQNTANRLNADIKKYDGVIENWPKLDKAIVSAKKLKVELENSEKLDLYNRCKAVKDKIEGIDSDLLNAACPTDSEILQARKLQRNITQLENKLCGMNISVDIKLLSDKKVELKSIITGEKISLDSGKGNINEAAKLVVEDVVEITLSPADVDAISIQSQISQSREQLNQMLKKYSVESIDDAEKLAKAINDAKNEAKMYDEKLKMLLGDNDYNALEEFSKTVKNEVRNRAEILNEVYEVCDSDNIDRFITAKETMIDTYRDEYDSVEALSDKINSAKNELDKTNELLNSVCEIPKEYENITNPKAHLAMLNDKLSALRNMAEDLLKEKTAASSRLEMKIEEISGDPEDNVNLAVIKFNEKKEMLDNWKHIYDKFLEQKQSINDNPLQDMADSFSKYLDIISDGRVETDFPNSEKLEMDIYSGNHLIDYDKLSEGTKETVCLAFRLAVVEHLFPDGDGVIVLDDPFADMDIDRAKKASELVKECAKNNQIILLTCREDYIDMLGGNLIRI